MIRAGKTISLSKILPITIILLSLTSLTTADPQPGDIEIIDPNLQNNEEYAESVGVEEFSIELSEVPGSSDEKIVLEYFENNQWNEIGFNNLSNNQGTTSNQYYPLHPEENVPKVSIQNGDSQTFTIDGSEFTVSVNSFTDGSEPSGNIDVNGVEYVQAEAGDIFGGSDEIYLSEIIQIGPDTALFEFKLLEKIDLDRPQKQYRLEYIDGSSTEFYSKPFYMTNRQSISAYPQEVRVNGSEVTFNNDPAVAPTDIEVQFFNPVDNEFAVGGYSPNGVFYNLNTYSRRNDFFGIIDTIDDVLVELVGNSTNANTYTFSFQSPASNSGATPNTFYRVLDFNKPGSFSADSLNNDTNTLFAGSGYSYRTGIYSYFVNQDNTPPSIQGIDAYTDTQSAVPINQLDGGDVDLFTATIMDESSRVSTNLVIKNEYDNKVLYNASANNVSNRFYTWNVTAERGSPLSLNESGQYTYTLTADDGFATDNVSGGFSVPWGDLNLELVEPSSDISILTNGSFGMDLRLTCSGGPECLNQNVSGSVFWDPKPVQKTSSLPGLYS